MTWSVHKPPSLELLMAFSRSSSWMLMKMVLKLMVKVGKVLLGVVVTLKVHEVYGKREVRPAPLVDGEEKIRN